jgi:hypothetical protein
VQQQQHCQEYHDQAYGVHQAGGPVGLAGAGLAAVPALWAAFALSARFRAGAVLASARTFTFR